MGAGHRRRDGQAARRNLLHRVPRRAEPGERLELLWPVGGELTLAGHALDPDGVPVAGLELWILAGKLPRHNLAPEDERLAFAVTRSQSDGSFAFKGLVPGRYHVGPAASESFASLAKAFQLQGSASELTLTCSPGVRLSGSVRAADGRPIPDVVVTARAPGLLFSTRMKDDGSFLLGPLAPGPYELVAHADGLDYAPLAAQGGDADLELVLPAAGVTPR